MDNTTFSLDHYFNRIHFNGEAKATISTVADIMRCQLFSIPFENLDIQAGKIISIEPNDIVDKLVLRRRGGYCYELNGLFSMAMNALKIPYFFVAARPIIHGVRKDKTHMAVIVELNNEKWLCDLGYGGYGIRAPLNLNSLDTKIQQDDDVFMLSKLNEQEFLLKIFTSNKWENHYSFDLIPQKWADFTAANYYNSSHPDSIFVRKLLVAMFTPLGRKILFGNTYKKLENHQQEKRFVTFKNRATLLNEEFGLIE